MLEWRDISLERDFIKVKTAKTGEFAKIPIFPLLRAELEQAAKTGPYVFPGVATMFQCNPDGVTWRIQRVFEAAGFFDARGSEDAGHRGNRHVAPKHRLRRASVRDFHSLRTTWITLALTAGVPEELVRRVTGHAAVEVVREFYFKPDEDALQEALAAKMPAMFSLGTTPKNPGDAASRFRAARAKLASMDATNWATTRDELAALLTDPLPTKQAPERGHGAGKKPAEQVWTGMDKNDRHHARRTPKRTPIAAIAH
jgi:hypothetical protein